MCFNVTVSIFALTGALAAAAAFAIVVPLMRIRIAFALKHYIVEAQKHAVSRPFSNEVGKKAAFVARKQARHSAFTQKKTPKSEILASDERGGARKHRRKIRKSVRCRR
jgi:hypothetical protein